MWKPIIESKDKEYSIILIREILSTVKDSQDASEISLYENNIGIDLLGGYASNYFDDENLLNDSVSSIQKYFQNDFTQTNHGLISGYTGLFWLLAHFNNIGLCETEKRTLNSLILHIENLVYSESKYNYDFFTGYLGLAICSMELKSHNKKIYDATLSKLSSIAEIDNKFCKWQDLDSKISFELNETSTCYNLGLAHGIPNTFVVLSKIYNITQNQLCIELIEKAINWVLSQRNKGIPLFPEILSNEKILRDISKSRIGWCYGDLSIGYSIYLVYKNTNVRKYKEIALDIIYNTLDRDYNNGNTIDNTLCL